MYTKTGPKIEEIKGRSGRREDTPMDEEGDASPGDGQNDRAQANGPTVSKEEVVKAEKSKMVDGTERRKGKTRVKEEAAVEKQETHKRPRLSQGRTSQGNEEKQEAPKRSTRIRRAPLRLKQEFGESGDEAIEAEEA